MAKRKPIRRYDVYRDGIPHVDAALLCRHVGKIEVVHYYYRRTMRGWAAGCSRCVKAWQTLDAIGGE